MKRERPTKIDYFISDLTKIVLWAGSVYIVGHLLAAFQSGRLPM